MLKCPTIDPWHIISCDILGPFDRKITNAPIPWPLSLITWREPNGQDTKFVTASAMVADLLQSGRRPWLDASYLVGKLGSKYYGGYECADVDASVSRRPAHSGGSQQGKVDDPYPDDGAREFSSRGKHHFDRAVHPNEVVHAADTSKIAQQVIYGNVTNITSLGAGATISIATSVGMSKNSSAQR